MKLFTNCHVAHKIALPGCVVGLFACGLMACGLIACKVMPTAEAGEEKMLAGELSVGIWPIESQLQADDPMTVLFVLSNGTEESIEILPWGTPLESKLTADRFTVSVDGQVIPYGGRIVKRAAPTSEDYLTIAVGEKKEAVVSLSDDYDVSAAGEYEIVLKELLFQDSQSSFLTPVIVEPMVTITRQ